MTDEERRKAEQMQRDLRRTAEMCLCSLIVSGKYTGDAPAALAARSHQIATAFLQEVDKYAGSE